MRAVTKVCMVYIIMEKFVCAGVCVGVVCGVCVCLCVCLWCMYVYSCMYMCACACVCMCACDHVCMCGFCLYSVTLQELPLVHLSILSL